MDSPGAQARRADRADRGRDAGAPDQGPEARLRHRDRGRVTGDLREATVFYTVFGTEEEQAGTAAALASATGLIRSEVGRQTGLQAHPVDRVQPDAVPDTARSIEDLVAKARDGRRRGGGQRAGRRRRPGIPIPTGHPGEDADSDDADEDAE